MFSPAPHVILGRTQSDQDWIDGEVEAGVGGCGFPRPGPRPAGLDAPATRQMAGSAQPTPVKKKGFFRRAREHVFPQAAPAVQQFPEQPRYITTPPVEPAPVKPVEAPRRDPVIEFLEPRANG